MKTTAPCTSSIFALSSAKSRRSALDNAIQKLSLLDFRCHLSQVSLRKDSSHFGRTAFNGHQFARHHFQQAPPEIEQVPTVGFCPTLTTNAAASTTAPQDSRTLEPAMLTGAIAAECFLKFRDKESLPHGPLYDLSPCSLATLLVRVLCLCFFAHFCKIRCE